MTWHGVLWCHKTVLTCKKAELVIHSNAWNELWWCLKYRKQPLTSTTLCGVLFKVPVDKEKGSRTASLTSICRVKDRMTHCPITEIKSVAIGVTNGHTQAKLKNQLKNRATILKFRQSLSESIHCVANSSTHDRFTKKLSLLSHL